MVLVSHLNELLQEGIGIDTASVQGAYRRLRPVLMTATTALGLISLLSSTGTGSEVQCPLATVVAGGAGDGDGFDVAGRARLVQMVCGRFLKKQMCVRVRPVLEKM